jgi:hypothetical protein
MARTPAPPQTTDGRQASVAAIEQAAASAKPEFDWSALPAPVAMANRQTADGIKVDVIASVPEVIRQRAEASLSINTERVKAAGRSAAKRARVDYQWELQAVPDTATGEQFTKLLTKYAKYRPSEGDVPHAAANSPKGQVTARCGTPGYFRTADGDTYEPCDASADGAFTGVRFSVRPFERRADTARLPGS